MPSLTRAVTLLITAGLHLQLWGLKWKRSDRREGGERIARWAEFPAGALERLSSHQVLVAFKENNCITYCSYECSFKDNSIRGWRMGEVAHDRVRAAVMQLISEGMYIHFVFFVFLIVHIYIKSTSCCYSRSHSDHCLLRINKLKRKLKWVSHLHLQQRFILCTFWPVFGKKTKTWKN